jgi:hypothetical protein
MLTKSGAVSGAQHRASKGFFKLSGGAGSMRRSSRFFEGE